MKRQTTIALALLATGAMLDCGSARAQARGPNAEEVREHGQYIAPPPGGYVRATELIGGWREIPIGEDPPDVELSALGPPGELDEATRRARIAELETWLTRLPGRFRIKGRIEKTLYNPTTGEARLLGDDVTGIADCVSVGEGVAVKCILNASWPNIDIDVADIGSRPTDSESLKTLQPGVLFLGLNLDPPGIRSMLVTDDSIAHTWAGRLTENTLRADRLTDCRDEDPPDFRCLQPFEVVASPDSENYSIILRRFRRTPLQSEPLPPEFPRTLTITISMVRDPEARAEKPMPTKKVR